MAKKKVISAKNFRILLEKACLNNLIAECALNVSDGTGKIVAVDPTNSVLLSVENEIDLQEGEYGLTNIPLLIKFLKSCQDEEVSYTISKDEKWLTLRRKSHGKLSILLTEDSNLISTKLEEEPDMEKYVEDYEFSIELTKSFIEDAMYYMGLVNEQGVQFNVKNGKTKLLTTTNQSQYFEVPLDTVDSDDDFAVDILSDQLHAVLSILDPNEKITMHLKSEFPIIIQQGESNYWALTPVIA